jgi:hypothetical protein
VAGKTDSLEQVADELYGLAPAEFTEARDALVKRLRADKERELANQVKGLRRPTVAAWALNQLVRNRRKDVGALLAAGEELREAQEQLVGGGDRSAFQRAAAKERELVAKLARDAASLAAEAGVGSSQGLEEKLISTLHAAALDEETAAELGAGRVLRERQAVAGFGGGFDMAPAPSKPAPKRAKQAKPPKEDAAKKERAAAAEAKAREELSAARLEERKAGRERDTAAKAAARAAERARKAEERAAETARRLDEAREELEEAQDQERAATERHESAVAAVAAAEKKLG